MVHETLQQAFPEMKDHPFAPVIGYKESNFLFRDKCKQASITVDIPCMLNNPLIIDITLVESMAPACQFRMLSKKLAVHYFGSSGIQDLLSQAGTILEVGDHEPGHVGGGR